MKSAAENFDDKFSNECTFPRCNQFSRLNQTININTFSYKDIPDLADDEIKGNQFYDCQGYEDIQLYNIDAMIGEININAHQQSLINSIPAKN